MLDRINNRGLEIDCRKLAALRLRELAWILEELDRLGLLRFSRTNEAIVEGDSVAVSVSRASTVRPARDPQDGDARLSEPLNLSCLGIVLSKVDGRRRAITFVPGEPSSPKAAEDFETRLLALVASGRLPRLRRNAGAEANLRRKLLRDLVELNRLSSGRTVPASSPLEPALRRSEDRGAALAARTSPAETAYRIATENGAETERSNGAPDWEEERYAALREIQERAKRWLELREAADDLDESDDRALEAARGLDDLETRSRESVGGSFPRTVLLRVRDRVAALLDECPPMPEEVADELLGGREWAAPGHRDRVDALLEMLDLLVGTTGNKMRRPAELR